MGFLGAAFFLILAPTSSFMPIQDLCFEHRMYLPLACVTITAALAGYVLLQRFSTDCVGRLGFGVPVCISLTLGLMTIARNRVYHDPVAMWSDVLEKTRHYRAPGNLGRKLNNLGDALLDAGRDEEGVEVLREAVRLNPGMPQIYGNLGRGLCELGHLEESRRYCEEAIAREPANARYRQQLGLLAVAEGRLAEAEQQFRAAAELNPSDDVILVNLGQCLVDQQRVDKAVNCFQRVLRRDPHAADARQRLATTLASAGRWDEAIVEASELARSAPQNARPHQLLGLIAVQRGENAAALGHFNKALQLNPDSASVHLQIGDVQRRLGNAQSAIRSYEVAVRLDDRSAEAHNNLGGLLVQDEPALAVRHFYKAVQVHGDFVEARFNLAATLTQLARYDEAIQQYDELLRLRPDFGPAQSNRDALVGHMNSHRNTSPVNRN